VPTHVHVAVVTFEVVSTIAALVAVSVVARGVWRARRLTLDAMLMLAWTATWWHDPLINWLRPTVFYNSASINAGSWTEHVPGWFSPNAQSMPEPLLIIGTVYVWMGVLCAVGVDRVMTKVERVSRRPSPIRAFLAAWLAVAAFEVTMEIIAVRTGLTGYPSSIRALTLWAGTTHQLPIYEMAMWSLVLTAVGALRHSARGRDGRTVVESGADRLGLSARRSTLIRLVAVIGFVNLAGLTYDVAMIATSTHAGPVGVYPSYLRTDQCGPGTAIRCPGPHVPLIGK
jgi:Spirocyclase AveC-like